MKTMFFIEMRPPTHPTFVKDLFGIENEVTAFGSAAWKDKLSPEQREPPAFALQRLAESSFWRTRSPSTSRRFGPHFRDYHLLLDDQGEQIFAMRYNIVVLYPRLALTSCINDRFRRMPIKLAMGAMFTTRCSRHA